MASDGIGGAVSGDLAEKTAHDSKGKEEEGDEHENVRQGAEALNERPD